VEGRLRQHICKNGQYHDVIRMAMLRSDWPAVRERFHPTPVEIECPPGVTLPAATTAPMAA
jgi:hypothetical protein